MTHLTKHSPVQGKVYCWSKLLLKFLIFRKKTKKTSKEEMIQCDECFKSFKSAYFKKHKLHHELRNIEIDKEKSFQCDFCSKFFKSKVSLNHSWSFLTLTISVTNSMSYGNNALYCQEGVSMPILSQGLLPTIQSYSPCANSLRWKAIQMRQMWRGIQTKATTEAAHHD